MVYSVICKTRCNNFLELDTVLKYCSCEVNGSHKKYFKACEDCYRYDMKTPMPARSDGITSCLSQTQLGYY
jgi:hypothetical protein